MRLDSLTRPEAAGNGGSKMYRQTGTGRRGLGLAEVVICIAIVGVLALLIAMALPRSRSSARTATCRRNLMQIGVALAVYAQQSEALPAVAPLATPGPSPLISLLRGLGQDDFNDMVDPAKPPARRGLGPVGAGYLPGLTCPSDRSATSAIHPAPISYRAVAGPGVDGLGGPFSVGRVTTLADIKNSDGASHTLAFVERLVGDGAGSPLKRGNYARVGKVFPDESCLITAETPILGDAGSFWGVADWRSTLANHALTPNAAPSCIAVDNLTARMGASSGHSGVAHGLLLDGSVRAFTDKIDPMVWRRWASLRDAPAPAGPAPPP